MYTYCKRNKYINKYSFGKNNKGHITIRGRQGKIFHRTMQLKNINYNYIYIKHIKSFIDSNNLIKLKILKKVIDSKLQKYIYKVLVLNSFLSNQYKYIPITKNTYEGDIIYIGGNISALKVGNIMPINKIPCGSWIHNIESMPIKGAVFVKNSKISAFLISIGHKYATIKLPSGEVRLVDKNVFCIFGELNSSPLFIKKYKAGFNRNLGKRPKVRGVAMNACDHPHGGGEGKNSIGRVSAYSPWGIPFKGVLTRKSKKYSTKLILKKK